jgi:hypothetical protein
MNTTVTKTAWICAALMLGCSSSNGRAADTMKGSSGTGGDSGTAGTRVDAGANGGQSGASSGGQSGTSGHASGTGGHSAGTGGSGDGMHMATGGKGAQACPPECLRAYECAASCDATPTNNGCCPCPTGTIDVITCPDKGNAPGYCGLPCSGAAPSDEVTQACTTFMTQKDCVAYHSDKFPYACAWLVPPVAPCLAP